MALSRAREGLFILGNAFNLASESRMWRTIIEELQRDDAVGTALPIVCQRHPDNVVYVREPGQLARLAPDGKPFVPQLANPLRIGYSRWLLEAL